ncbi:WS/DGAT/MGAT family O-acyltransferase [Mycobacterium deserti]|uniref:Diacylglycerol O-acyltransferase n=1 Tax=Mycobacterium deserti TaxID=2978347 RepID=A0ABT2M976_9MYCO|nr:wax ester/triacylglycerol synthase family O-acyltransferase [Mycobacterium deserti]MCT7658799.1 wax ester/triacylglycerol synthase family O-acyltransferase [Mycobacterium deserti]
MRQLSSLDTQFLAIEDGRRTGHVGALAVYDPSTAPDATMTCATMMALLRKRMHLLPPLRWRLSDVPFGLDYPYWVTDDNFDLTYHVREAALPSPGSDTQLAALVSRLHSHAMDRARPLWEMYVISGLKSGRVAVYTKIHHAVIDGVSGAEITGLLLDVSPQGRDIPPPEWPPKGTSSSAVQRWGRALLGVPRYPARVLRAVPRALPNLDETVFSALPGVSRAGRLAGRRTRTPMAAPKTSFNGRLTPNRRFAFGRLDLERVKAVKNAHGVTVNDVVVSICAGAVRRWLIDHEELPDQPLVAQIPVSVRTDEHAGTFGNRVQMLAAPLYTNIADPAARLRATATSMREIKDRHRALPADLLIDVNHFIPPALFSRAARATFALATSRVGRPTWNVVVSNVPGPQIPLYCGGSRLVAHYPVSVITDGLGLNITVMSYDGHLDVGIVADREQMPDVMTLLDGLEMALAYLEDTARRVRRRV